MNHYLIQCSKFCDIMWFYLGRMSLYFTWVDLSVYWLHSICLCLRPKADKCWEEPGSFCGRPGTFWVRPGNFFMFSLLFHIYNYGPATIFARSQMLVDLTRIHPTSMFVSAKSRRMREDASQFHMLLMFSLTDGDIAPPILVKLELWGTYHWTLRPR